MESEIHQVREEANRKRLVSQFPHCFPSRPPPDNNIALGPTWRLRTPPTLTNAHDPVACFECEAVGSNMSLSLPT